MSPLSLACPSRRLRRGLLAGHAATSVGYECPPAHMAPGAEQSILTWEFNCKRHSKALLLPPCLPGLDTCTRELPVAPPQHPLCLQSFGNMKEAGAGGGKWAWLGPLPGWVPSLAPALALLQLRAEPAAGPPTEALPHPPIPILRAFSGARARPPWPGRSPVSNGMGMNTAAEDICCPSSRAARSLLLTS